MTNCVIQATDTQTPVSAHRCCTRCTARDRARGQSPMMSISLSCTSVCRGKTLTDFMTFCNQNFDNLRAAIAGGSCDEHFHGVCQ